MCMIYMANPDLRVSTFKLKRQAEQLKFKLNSRTVAISACSLKLAGINCVALLLMKYGVSWINHYIPFIKILMPYIGLKYNLLSLLYIFFNVIISYPSAVGYETIKEEIQRRRPPPMVMNDIH